MPSDKKKCASTSPIFSTRPKPALGSTPSAWSKGLDNWKDVHYPPNWHLQLLRPPRRLVQLRHRSVVTGLLRPNSTAVDADALRESGDSTVPAAAHLLALAGNVFHPCWQRLISVNCR